MPRSSPLRAARGVIRAGASPIGKKSARPCVPSLADALPVRSHGGRAIALESARTFGEGLQARIGVSS
ncbi:hypothetical protein [Nocardia mexicana]|uniref:hypothetical protein n=1 Tax=Nocardia mexicana TaxID=279262 RepID=UPI000834038B|nr:hypothetical protein [Nocardia mexicana]